VRLICLSWSYTSKYSFGEAAEDLEGELAVPCFGGDGANHLSELWRVFGGRECFCVHVVLEGPFEGVVEGGAAEVVAVFVRDVEDFVVVRLC
jgi:hypothetical protein